MSTLAYERLTSTRDVQRPGTSKKDAPPGVGSFVDVLSALVPAEVLTLHALILPFSTTTDGTVTTLENRMALGMSFIVLIVFCILLYVVPRVRSGLWDKKLDPFRALIPALAFVAWTMIQRATAFDALFPNVPDALRYPGAIILAALLSFFTTQFANAADERVVNGKRTPSTTGSASPQS